MDEKTRALVEEAKRKQQKIQEKSKSSQVKDIGTLDEHEKWVCILLDIVPTIGALHWITPAGDRKAKAKPYQCLGNLTSNESYGSAPDICPACYANTLGDFPNVDTFQGKSNGAQLEIFYRAYLGRVKARPDGSSKIEWDSGPCVLKVKPSVNEIFSKLLGDINYGEGDIRAYLWEISNTGDGYDKYKGTRPFINKGMVLQTPTGFIAERDKYIEMLPSLEDLLKPGNASEMIEDIGLTDFIIKQPEVIRGEVPPPSSKKEEVKAVNVESPSLGDIIDSANNSSEVKMPADGISVDDLPEIL